MAVKTVAEKLGIKPKSTIWLSHPDRLALVEPLPENVWTTPDLAEATFALFFADDAAAIRGLLEANAVNLAKPALIWVAYPKANRVDINRDTLWPILVDFGMRPNGQVALDDVWSAMRYRMLKEGEAPFTGGN